MAFSDARKELDCSVCLNIYTDPVTLKCGHNFCRDCIERVLDTQGRSGLYCCPECREEFQERPELPGNITLRNIVKSFRSTDPEQKETEIFCTHCIHSPVPAVKSCLHCEASLCDNHLKVHSKSPQHVLCDLTNPREGRKCSVHKKILEYYCSEDSACLCGSCRLHHQDHQVETLEEASEKRKENLTNALQKMMKEREEMEQSIESLKKYKRKVQDGAAGVTKRVTTLVRDIKRQLDTLERKVLNEISREAEKVSFPASDLIRELEIKKDELSRKMRHMEEICNMTEPLSVLQGSDTGDLCDIEDGDEKDRESHNEVLCGGGDLDVVGISHTLYTGLSNIVTGVYGGIYIPEPADILLDVDTAHNYLLVADDRKAARKVDRNLNRPPTPERFQVYQTSVYQRYGDPTYRDVITPQNVVERVANMPLVSSACSMVSGVYSSTKDSHPYIRSVCDVAEIGAKTLTGAAVTGSKPILSRLEPHIVTANELACRGLDKLESTLPILQQPADQVVSDAKSLVTGARDAVFGAVTSTATGARDTVTGALSGVVGLAGGTIQGSISATQSVVSTVMESHVGQFVTSSIDAVLGKTEEWMDHYLPMTDEELSRLSSSVEGFEVAPLQQQREQQSYYVRLGSLSSRIRHRAYQHSLGKALDSRVLGMTQMMTKQLQTTCFTLVSGAQGLPANIQEHVQQLRQNVQELHTSFASVWSLGNLSSRILAQSRAKVNQHVQELFDYMLVNLPLTRVVGPFAPQLVERPETPETQQTSEAQQE